MTTYKIHSEGDRNPWLDYEPDDDAPAFSWIATSDEARPVVIGVGATASVAYGGPIYLEIVRGDSKVGLFIDRDTWDHLHDAGLVAARHREEATAAGWT